MWRGEGGEKRVEQKDRKSEEEESESIEYGKGIVCSVAD